MTVELISQSEEKKPTRAELLAMAIEMANKFCDYEECCDRGDDVAAMLNYGDAMGMCRAFLRAAGNGRG